MDDIDAKQGTEGWHKKRCGRFTGSRFDDVIRVSKSTGKPLKARNDLIWSVATERIQGYQPEGMTSHATEWGKNNEGPAREAYELKTGEFVEEIDFILHPEYDFIGVSPDGIINNDGGLEIKAPKCPEIHLQRFIYGVPDEYVAQIQGAMWVTGRAWWDFVSYDPDTAEAFKLLIIRVPRDEKYIKNLESEILKAEIEVNYLVEILLKKVA